MSSHLPPGSPGAAFSPGGGRPSSATSTSGRPAIRSSGGLPPPPLPMSSHHNTSSKQSYAQSIAQSMTIDEMRDLHRRALNDAEAKRTELRLVLASRYRELVGSSDEVLKMRERSQELQELIHALPGWLTTLVKENDAMMAQIQQNAGATSSNSSNSSTANEESKEAPVLSEPEALLRLRHQVSTLPRVVHRYLDQSNVHGAALGLMELFKLLAHQTDAYPLATALAKSTATTSSSSSTAMTPQFKDPALNAQIKMTFLHVQTLPDKVTRMSKQILEGAASYGPLLKVAASSEKQPPVFGAQWSAAALSALDLLDTTSPASANANRASRLLDLYYDSKAKLLQSLLAQLQTSSVGTTDAAATTAAAADAKTKSAAPDNAGEILSKILLILQYDIILHPYQIFVLRQFPITAPSTSNNSKSLASRGATPAADIMASLPTFDAATVRARCSHFLAAHLPLLRTKVKSILVSIAGTTASALGQMRQSLYDKTDGADCMSLLKDEATNLCTWDDAVSSLVDIPIVAAGGGMPVLPASPEGGGPRFSLWSALFSNTFSSLVHNILTTSFHSVHTKVVSTLQTSLANAPPLEAMRPHEAFRNTLKIATDLDQALWNVRKDAHELLVHAEEREESERRLRLSLYVQTCEIMGRLVCELRRMILLTSAHARSDNKTSADAVQELIVGRLCYLLKFRLTSLPTLLDPQSAPSSSAGAATSAAAGGIGMITRMELQSAFELADDNDDGLITFEEAMEAVDSAFSGTPFHGAEMVRETLLLNISGAEAPKSASDLIIKKHESKDSMDSFDVGSAIVKSSVAPVNVTLSELALLTARGLRHETTGTNSALGTVQHALDDIVENCFQEWAKASLRPSLQHLSLRVDDFYRVGYTTKEEEWRRIFHTGAAPEAAGAVEKVSPAVVAYLLDVCSVLNRTIFPSDSVLPVPSMEYASSLGIEAAALDQDGGMIPTMKDTIRWSLVRQSLALITNTYQDAQENYERMLNETDEGGKKKYGDLSVSALLQLKTDISFIQKCFYERLQPGLASKFEEQKNTLGVSKSSLESLLDGADTKLRRYPNAAAVANTIPSKHQQVMEATDLFLASLFGGTDESVETSALTAPPMDLGTSGTNATPWINNPLPSSRRFALLPVQSDRGLTEMQLRKYGKKNAEENNQQDSSAGLGQNLQKGFGYFFGR